MDVGEGRVATLLLALATILCLATGARAGQVLAEIPDQINPGSRYLIFIQGPAPGELVAQAFANRGFEVVTERRKPNPDPFDLARKATGQIRKLRDAGVTSPRIALMGYDQGGAAALIASALLGESDLSYVVLAGCGLDDRYRRFASQLADKMTGRLLHLWEKTDTQAESCQFALSKARELDSDEKLLSNGGGHEMFGEVDAFWIDLVMAFLERR